MSDFLYRSSLEELDPDVYQLTQLEAERQYRKLILIPSESSAPEAVLEAYRSAFHNIYAEGYPPEDSRKFDQEQILHYEARLGNFRRFADPRYYKGVEYADAVESLARRRCAEAFAANGVSAEEIYVNVQALSGAPANNAVYHALVQPGDTIMGMNLLHGGHLTHGSEVNRSGKYFNAVHYTIDPETERIDYDQVEELASKTKPKFIIAGYSSYPWSVDWARFKQIAKSVGAYLFADIAHVAGLVAGGVYPSPIGYADVITFTTHKSLCGPRGACILTLDPDLSRRIDRAVFPGEQGGPHVNVFAAMSVAFKIARTEQFKQLQQQIVTNCGVFCDRFKTLGFKIPYGGTDTHLMNLDCSAIKGADGTGLSGDQAARILDCVGVVVNRNTIPGDSSALDPSGIRMGTPWITQRGFREPEIIQLADVIAETLGSVKPFFLAGMGSNLRRGKLPFGVLESQKIKVRDLAEKMGIDYEPTKHGYPHFYYLDDGYNGRKNIPFEIGGERARQFVNFVFPSDVEGLLPGQAHKTTVQIPDEKIDCVVGCLDEARYFLIVPAEKAAVTSAWLRDLSDGYVITGKDVYRKIPGPIWIKDISDEPKYTLVESDASISKPYYLGIEDQACNGLPAFNWEQKDAPLRRTPLYDLHKSVGAKMVPFAGWEMPVLYTSILEEHLAVRNAAGIFDVAHMGVYQAEGPDAVAFLDGVVGNDIGRLLVGKSCYTHLLDPDANVIDDLIIYRRGIEKFLIVVNAANDDKDWAWLNAVKDGKVRISNECPGTRAFGRKVILRNLKDPSAGEDMRVDIALQGPSAREALIALGVDAATRRRIIRLRRTELCEAVVGGFDLVVSRTGYTGEKRAYELFVHPDKASEFVQALLKAGAPLGVRLIGLGARDSLRTEAGLPLYGHEMGAGSGKLGEKDLGVGDSGFGAYIKTYKSWFIGREAFLKREKERKNVVVRFRFTEKGVRVAHPGDPVLDKRGRVIGWVTSCALDSDGLLTGQAYIELKSSEKGTLLFIYQGAPDKPGLSPSGMKYGDRSVLPTPAVVVRRFPK